MTEQTPDAPRFKMPDDPTVHGPVIDAPGGERAQDEPMMDFTQSFDARDWARALVYARRKLAEPEPHKAEPEQVAAPYPVTLGASDDSMDWISAARRLGESLAADGPEGYYTFTPEQWFRWASAAVALLKFPPPKADTGTPSARETGPTPPCPRCHSTANLRAFPGGKYECVACKFVFGPPAPERLEADTVEGLETRIEKGIRDHEMSMRLCRGLSVSNSDYAAEASCHEQTALLLRDALAELRRLRAEIAINKHARALSLLGRSSEQEAREEGLREKLAEAEIRAEQAEARASSPDLSALVEKANAFIEAAEEYRCASVVNMASDTEATAIEVRMMETRNALRDRLEASGEQK